MNDPVIPAISASFYPYSIPIVFASDNCFVPYMSVMMQSIMENAAKTKNYHFFVLYRNITGITIDTLKRQIGNFKQFGIDFINIGPYIKQFSFFTENRSDITAEAYFRLAIPGLFYQYEKVIYLDGDMICCIDISELFEIDIGDNWIASSRDILGIGTYYRYGSNSFHVDDTLFDGLSALKEKDNYFLSGLLIFNIKKWTMSMRELLEFAASRHWQIHDQDVLNTLCEGRTYILPLEYQFTDFSQKDDFHYCIEYLPVSIRQEYFNARKAPKIIHFNTYARKPWNIPFYTPHFELFWGYASRTPFIDHIISLMKEKKLIGGDLFSEMKTQNENLKNRINKIRRIQSLTFDNRLKDHLFFPALKSCFVFPWYIYKIFCMVYNQSFPKHSVRILLRCLLFFPYYTLKIYLTLVKRNSAL
jgi:lipopolysaccharide biosynthesis glycosyltransferase